MKISNNMTTVATSAKAHSSNERHKTPLPIVSAKLTKDELVLIPRSEFEIRNKPRDPNSTQYTKMATHINGLEDPQSIIHWKKEVESIWVGTGTRDTDQVVCLVAPVCYSSTKDSYLSKTLEARNLWDKQGAQYETSQPWLMRRTPSMLCSTKHIPYHSRCNTCAACAWARHDSAHKIQSSLGSHAAETTARVSEE